MRRRLCERERECVLLARPFGYFPSQTSESGQPGSQGPERTKHCLNDVITIHLFPLYLFHLGVLSLMVLILFHYLSFLCVTVN